MAYDTIAPRNFTALADMLNPVDESTRLDSLNLGTILSSTFGLNGFGPKIDAGSSAPASPAIQTYEITDGVAPASFTPNDPFFANQWHLNGQYGINVQDVWDDYTGQGVTIGFIDDGVQYTHPDLDGNYDGTIDYDSYDNSNDGGPKAYYDEHGTSTSGVAAAEGDNALGVTGVAFDADVTSFRLNFNANVTNAMLVELFDRAAQVDVVNNSWGFNGYFGDDFDTVFSDVKQEFVEATSFGRGGLGTNIVFAAGNGRTGGDNTNYHSFQNSPYVIAVGATDDNGHYTSFSTPGANVLVSAPGEGIVSTDRTGSDGYVNGDYVSGLAGTSFSAPIVSGVVALMLEANPDLGWRDVQEILAYSARNSDPGHSGWETNGADNWNGGGLHFSHNFGFGLVDAHDAVRLAETWLAQSTTANWDMYDTGTIVVNGAIPDNSTIGFSNSVNITGTDIIVDRVQVHVNIDHTWIGDLRIRLTSPDGTESILVDRPGRNPDRSWGSGTSQDDIVFTLASNAFWGEQADGVWTLTVMDVDRSYTGTIYDWSLRLLGDDATGNDVFFYSDEFSNVANASRTTLSDSSGTDTINAAMVTSNTMLSLVDGTNSIIDGVNVGIQAGTLIENAFTGDGNDTVIGNALANSIDTGRGDDLVEGGGGSDGINGGAGLDTARFLGIYVDFIISIIDAMTLSVQDNNLADGDEGTDLLTNIEQLLFDGVLYIFNGSSVVRDGLPPENIPPDAVDDSTTTDYEEAVNINVLANDTDGNGDSLDVTGINTGPAHGSAVVNADDTITYTPDAGWSGEDSFTYDISDGNGGTDTATVTVTTGEAPPPNIPPDAVDDSANTGFQQAVNIAVLSNDTDGNGDSLDVTGINTGPAHGSAIVNADDTITYTPDAGWSGEDSFTYDISDGNGGTDTATVTVTTAPNTPPDAVDDSANTGFQQAVNIAVLANDTDGDGDSLDVTGINTGPAHGSAVVNANDTITYTPDAGWSGEDSFTYDISDGNGGTDTATVTVNTAANTPPDAVNDSASTDAGIAVTINVLNNDTDGDGDPLDVTGINTGPSHGSVVVNANDTITYTPDAGWTGQDSFTYDISDGNGGTDTATVTVTTNEVQGETVRGSYRADILEGTNGNDTIYAGGGDDLVYAYGGSDNIQLSSGHDTVYAGAGDDDINASSGNDTIYGEEGNDYIRAGSGNDFIYGGEGDDTIYGDSGTDTFIGGPGADTMYGYNAATDIFIYESMADAGDNITYFKQGQDVLDLQLLFDSIGYAGADPVGDGYMSFNHTGSNLEVFIDPDGAGPDGSTLLLTLNNVSFTTLNAGSDYLV